MRQVEFKESFECFQLEKRPGLPFESKDGGEKKSVVSEKGRRKSISLKDFITDR